MKQYLDTGVMVIVPIQYVVFRIKILHKMPTIDKKQCGSQYYMNRKKLIIVMFRSEMIKGYNFRKTVSISVISTT